LAYQKVQWKRPKKSWGLCEDHIQRGDWERVLTLSEERIAQMKKERIRLLSLVDILEPLSTEEIEGLNKQLSDIHLEAGEIFFNPQDRSEKLFLLQKGRVRIYRTSDGHEFTLAVVDEGTIFGEMALTAQQLQGAYAQAMKPCEISVMHREDLERLILGGLRWACR